MQEWHTIYSCSNQSGGNNYIVEICVAVTLFAVGPIGVLHKGMKYTFPFRISTLSPYGYIVFSLIILFYVSYSFYIKYRLISDSANGRCTIYEGRLEKIFPELGGGEMKFQLATHIFPYDSHHFALHKQLCDADGPSICEGDVARVCVHNDRDGEILKLENRAG
jgi:hypothetical protein